MPERFIARHSDPTQVKVQLNIKVPWEYREHLIATANERGVSLNRLVNDALNIVLPLYRGVQQ